MSDVYKDLSGRRIDRKRVTKVIVVAGILFAIFAFQNVIFSFLLGGPRENPNTQLDGTDYYDVIEDPIPLPLDFLLQLLSQLSPEQLEAFSDMMDGYLNGQNMAAYGALLALLLTNFTLAEQELFRVYDYDVPYTSMTDILWKYECYDEYTGTDWTTSEPKQVYSFTPNSDFTTIYKPQGSDDYQIKMPITPLLGVNSLMIPTLFPNPYVIDGSVVSNTSTLETLFTTLYKTNLNSTILDVVFNGTANAALKFKLFGLAGLPTENDINNTAVDEIYTPVAIASKYLQLPPSISDYINNNNNFRSHFNALQSIILPQDTAWTVVYKIRDYLINNFVFGFNEYLFNGPAAGSDEIEWFCGTQEGIWSHFASTFTALSRVFNVSARYVNGYNSFNITEQQDPNEFNKDYFAIKLKNMYNWAEVYIPTDISGTGLWVEIDVTKNVSLAVSKELRFYINDTTWDDFYSPIVPRYSTLNLTARVLNESGAPLQGETVKFYDYTNNSWEIGTDTTDMYGNASILYTVSSDSIAGPNLLYAQVAGAAPNYSYFILNQKPNIKYISGPTPFVINRTAPGDIEFYVEGSVIDPVNGKSIPYSYVELKLIKGGFDQSGYLIPQQLEPSETDSNGYFNLSYRVSGATPPGNYSLNMTFTGWLNYSRNPFPYFYNLPSINNETTFPIELTIEAPDAFFFDFRIDGTPNDDYNNPVINRRGNMNLSVYIQWGGAPIANGEWVDFYDTTQGIMIGSNQTISGRASYIYNTNNFTTAGPHYIYAHWNGRYNYSYFILNDKIKINFDINPKPTVIARVGPSARTFTITGFLNDSLNNNSIKYGLISVGLFDGPTDVSFYLSNVGGSLQLNETGKIFLKYNVIGSTPEKNYTVKVWFNGSFIYPHFYSLSGFSNFSTWDRKINILQIYDPYNIKLNFWINGTPTLSFYDDGNRPERFNRGDFINFTVYVENITGPVVFDDLRIFNIFNNSFLLDLYTYDGSEIPAGYHSFLIDTSSWYAGLHNIKVNWSTFGVFNTTYIIINETIDISINLNTPSLKRGTGTISVYGTITESGMNLRGLRIRVRLFDKFYSDASGNITSIPQVRTINDDGTYSFPFSVSSSTSQGIYKVRVDFNGSIDAPGIFLTDYMIHWNSSLIDLNITTDVIIVKDGYHSSLDSQYPEYSDQWINGSVLYVYGNITWDNGTGLSGVIVNVTVETLGGSVLSFNISIPTDIFGGFNVSITVKDFWPTYRSQTKIYVEFDPVFNSIPYVQGKKVDFT